VDYLDFLLDTAPLLAPSTPSETTNAKIKSGTKKQRKPTAEELDLLDEYGLVDDTPPFASLPAYVAYTCGATLAAANALTSAIEDYPLAIAWDGGRHHSRRAKAGGFCHANDLVLAIQSLLSSRFGARGNTKVMYLDLDVHFGDGVFEAFEHSRSVLCASVHVGIPGFYPPGVAEGLPELGPARDQSGIRIGTRPGLSDGSFAVLLEPLKLAFDKFSPDFLVIQAGSDGLSRDPLAGQSGWSLSSTGFASAVAACASWAVQSSSKCKVLVTGGGGYSNADVARAWSATTWRLVALLGAPLGDPPSEVPEHAFLNSYAGDGYSMVVEPGLKEDENLKLVDVAIAGQSEAEKMRYLDYLVRRAMEDLNMLGLESSER
jgi:histone deacetylase 8